MDLGLKRVPGGVWGSLWYKGSSLWYKGSSLWYKESSLWYKESSLWYKLSSLWYKGSEGLEGDPRASQGPAQGSTGG